MQTNRRSTRRSLLVSATALILSIAMLVGTTFAWFTDTVSSGVNKIQAGNLDIEVEYKKPDGSWATIEGTNSLFSSNLWEPGHTEYVTLKIENKGTLALNYKVLVSPVSESGGINVDNQNFKLSDFLKFGTTGIDTSETTYASREDARNAVQGSTVGLNEANLNNMTKAATMNAGGTQYMTLVVYMPENVGNEANYKTGTAAPTIDLGITVRATQKTQESDSFGNDYDAGAVNTPEYVAGAYYDYFEAVNVLAPADETGKFNVQKTTDTGIIASASGTATAGASVNLIVMKSSDSEKNFSVTVGEGYELNGYEIKVTGQQENSLVQGQLYVGTGLEEFTFYHNSTAMDLGTVGNLNDGEYYYNSDDGYVYFATTTFSPFQATYKAPVAAIGTAVYGTVQDAMTAAKAGETVVLLMKTEVSETISVDKSVTLNLNGKKIAGKDIRVFQVKQGTLTLTGAGTVTSVKADQLDEASSVIRVGDNGTVDTKKQAGFVIDKDVTIDAPNTYGVTVFGSATTENVVVKGKIHAVPAAAISGNGSTNYDGTTITVETTAQLISENDAAIYQPQAGTLTVKGGIIRGTTAIEAKSGTINIQDGELTATSGVTHEANGNGTSTKGYALAVVKNDAYAGNTVATVTGGSFTGAIAVLEDNVTEKTGSISITGGKYSDKPDQEYLAPEYKAASEDGYFVVVPCTNHVYENGVCTECGKVQETWLAIENAMTEAPEGYSEENNTILISTNYGLAWFAKQVNEGNNYSAYTVNLNADIDLLDYAWTPINGFTGTFDGGNHIISNLYVNGSPAGKGYGLFGQSNAKAYKNVKIHNVYVVGNAALGALVGDMFTGTVDNVHVSGNITIGINTQNGHIANYSSSYAGGVVGHGYAKISNCSVKGDDGSTIGHGRQVGGIYGFSGEGNFTPVKNCTVENVTLVGTKSIGGILGWAHYGNNVENCSVKNINVKITNSDRSSIGFITGTTNAEDCGTNQMMEFYGNTVQNSSLYVNDVFVSNESTMENMYASYGYGPCYTTDGNGNYVFFANKTEADKYVPSHSGMTIKYTSFNGQIAGAEDGATIDIDQDMSLPRIELLQNKTITIDLKGHTVTDTGADAFLVTYGKLIVVDSIGGGKIIHTGTDDLVWLQENGTLQLDAGSYSFATKYGITYGTGSLIINGGTYVFDVAKEESMKEYVASGKTVTINGVSYTKE